MSEPRHTSDPTDGAFPRITTGNPQADEILCGGFPANSINIIMGQPGTGKTVFAEQLLFHNAHGDRPLLYLTTVSEPLSKVVTYVQRFRFFDATKLGTQIVYDDVGAELAQRGPQALVDRVRDAIKTLSPKLIVIDSYRAIHDLALAPGEMRRVIAELAGLLSAYDTTAFLIGEYVQDDIHRYPEFAVADSIVQLAREPLGSHDERFFRVLKLRGSSYRQGQHAVRITSAGLEIFPRLVTPTIPEAYQLSPERIPTGIAGLDPIIGGGLWVGSTTLLVGPTGSGKTTLGLQFALEGVRRGEQALFVNFQENPSQVRRLVANLGADYEVMRQRGLHLVYASPVELQIDSIIVGIFEQIQQQGIRRIVVDAVGDLASAASDPQRLHDYLYALVQHFTVRGVTSMLTFESVEGLTGEREHQQRFSYVSDNIVLLTLPGMDGTPRTLRVVKTRNSAHEPGAHTFDLTDHGGRVL
jgi:circadian clock protein KaiC